MVDKESHRLEAVKATQGIWEDLPPESSKWPCSPLLLELRNQMKEQINEEYDSAKHYKNAAKILRESGEIKLADKFNLIAADEESHAAILEASVEIITGNCGE